jgi:serine phosphatase RsbU (regulator of sigma subunit)
VSLVRDEPPSSASADAAGEQRVRASFVSRFLIAAARDQPLHPWRVLVICVAVEAGFLTAIALADEGPHMLGMPGSLVALTVVIAGVLAGPLIGSLTALAAGPIFYVTVGGLGERSHALTTVASTCIWVAGGLLAGLLAGALREQSERRREADVALAAERAARKAQDVLEASLLPTLPIDHPAFRVATAYDPGDEGRLLGGDFIDVAALPDGGLALVIGDVAGHGPHAAALGAGLRAGWQALVRGGASPSAMFNSLSELARANGAPDGDAYEMFATACFAWLDARGRRLELLSAGHPPPLLIGSTVAPVPVEPLSPLGVEHQGGTWRPATFELPASWSLLFYTDGLVEGRCEPGSPERYGVERLADRLSALPSIVADGTLVSLVDEIKQTSVTPLPDDIAAIAVAPNR